MPLADNQIKIQTLLDGINALPEAIKLQEKTTTPTLEAQVISPDSGYGGLSNVTVNAMPTAAQAVPEITVSAGGLITASATQSAGYVDAGTKTATRQLSTQAAQTITPGTTDKTIASGRYLTGTQTIKGDSDLKAENIKSGVSIFNVLGTLEEGGLPDGVSALASGTFTLTSDDSTAVNVTHNLGVVPNFGVCIIEEAAVNMEKPALIGIASIIKNIYRLIQTYVYYGGDGTNQQYSADVEYGGSTTSDTEYLFTNNNIPFGAGYTYRWVCGVIDGIN